MDFLYYCKLFYIKEKNNNKNNNSVVKGENKMNQQIILNIAIIVFGMAMAVFGFKLSKTVAYNQLGKFVIFLGVLITLLTAYVTLKQIL